MKQESENQGVGPIIPILQAQKRTAVVTGVSVRVVSKINIELKLVKEAGCERQLFSTPGNKRDNKSKPNRIRQFLQM